MGVTGLWKLVEQCGKTVPVDVLENQILAVDISIWLHQCIKGFQDNKGGALSYAHILGLFYRLLKLLNYRVRPIFVFDGGVPQLKRDTIARRAADRSKLNKESDRLQALILQSLAKEKVVQQALGPNASELLVTSPTKRLLKDKRDEKDDMFKLPELPEPPKLQVPSAAEEEHNDSQDDYSDSFEQSTTSFEDDSSFDECTPRYAYNSHLQRIDVTSEHFRNLPANIRHEILVDLKETRKQSSWGRLHELPKQSDDFSNFQMGRLLKRRAIQVSLQDAEQEMGGRSLTYAEFQSLFAEEGLIDASIVEGRTRQICSDENTRFLLVRDLQKKVKTETNESIKEEDDESKKNAESNIKKEEQKCIKSEDADENDLVKAAKIQSAIQLLKDIAAQGTSHGRQRTVSNEIVKEVDKLLIEEKLHKAGSSIPKKSKSADSSDSSDSFEEVKEIFAQKPMEIIVKTDMKPQDDMFADIFEDYKEFNKEAQDNYDVVEIMSSDNESDSDDDIETTNSAANKGIDETNSKDSLKVINQEPKINEVETISSQNSIEIIEDKEMKANEDKFADVFQDFKAFSNKEKADNDVVEIMTSDDDEDDDKNKIATEESNLMEKTPNKTFFPHLTKEVLKQMEEAEPTTNPTNGLVLKPTKPNSSKANEILKALQESLDDLKKGAQSTGLAELSANIRTVTETIELIDETWKSPSVSPTKSLKNAMTPSKNKTINDFFDTEYLIKRTPEKVKDDEPSPKVKSPFFVKKTPKSERKKLSSPRNTENSSKAAKSLFNIDGDDEAAGGVDGVTKITPPTTEDLINEAAVMLKTHKTEDELRTMADDLAKQQRDLATERNRQERMGSSVSQRMVEDCKKLLRLFGIPYIVAPMEAEAQCAFFDARGVTQGTITDDSDIWLFGGRKVYKNFFDQDKNVLEFHVGKIEKAFNVDRQKLIQFAYLVGSDYTTGIHGIGAVTALEILGQFNNFRETVTSTQNVDKAALMALQRFRDWWLQNKNTTSPPGSSMRLALWKKLKNIELQEGFPNPAIIESYVKPVIDDSEAPFQWGAPDVESIREFAKKTFGWTRTKTDGLLMPVLKRMNERTSQSSIKNYFKVGSPITQRPLQLSKRVRQAVDKLSKKNGEEPTEGDGTEEAAAVPKKPKRMRKAKADNDAKKVATKTNRVTKRKSKTNANTDEATVATDEATNATTNEKETVTATSAEPQRRGPQPNALPSLPENSIKPPARKAPRLAKLREAIPQREMEEAQMRANMEKAIEIVKQAKQMGEKK